MAEIKQVVDADGGVTAVEYAAPRIIVSYSRKISEGLPQYESAEAFCSVQADVALDGSDTVSAINEAFATAKAAVLKQLGRKSETTDDGIVNELISQLAGEVVQTTPKAPASKRSNPGNAGPKRTVADLWKELESDPSKFFDNRGDKKNPNAPDFKRKATGEGLWLFDKDGSSNAEKYGVTIP